MATKFQFTLKFDNEGTEDFINVADSEVHRILSTIMACNGVGETATNLLLDISATQFYVGGGTPNAVIKSMLCFLVMDPERRSVSYCFNCDKYVMGKVNTSICAYDTVGQSDSHRTFHIDIREVAIPSIEATCQDTIFQLKSEMASYSEGLTCSREFLNKLLDIVCMATEASEGSDCNNHHACGTEPDDHCSCYRN